MEKYSRYPEVVQVADMRGVLQHLADTIGFRYYWATEGLVEADLPFRPVDGAFTLGEQLAHIRRLVVWAGRAFQGDSGRLRDEPAPLERLQTDTFSALDELKGVLDATDIAAVRCFDKPFWYLVHGPLADCLTHIGQVNTYRRLLGKPARPVNHFFGVPVEE